MNAFNQRLSASSSEFRLYCLQSLPSHLADAGQQQRFRLLLTDFDFIYAKVAALRPQSVIKDYDLSLSPDSPMSSPAPLNNDDPLRQIQRAIRVSADLLGGDSTQLPGQLLARLSAAESPALQSMLHQVSQWRATCWLRPLKASLAPTTGPLVRILEGDPEGVNAVAITPDGTQLVSGSTDHPLRVWDLTTGNIVMTLHGHTGTVQEIAITLDGSRVVSAFDGAIGISDLKSGKFLRRIEGPNPPIAITPDGACLVARSKDRTLGIWNLASGHLMRAMNDENELVCAAVITPDGAQLVSTSEKYLLKVWDLKTGKKIRTLEDRNGSQNALAITPDGKHVVAAGNQTLRVWYLKTGKVVRTFEDRAGWPEKLVITSAPQDFQCRSREARSEAEI